MLQEVGQDVRAAVDEVLGEVWVDGDVGGGGVVGEDAAAEGEGFLDARALLGDARPAQDVDGVLLAVVILVLK